jgi:hypothetical protein
MLMDKAAASNGGQGLQELRIEHRSHDFPITGSFGRRGYLAVFDAARERRKRGECPEGSKFAYSRVGAGRSVQVKTHLCRRSTAS